MNAVIVHWVEFERGMGQRPDGFSIHSDVNECLKYVEEYWKRMPKDTPDEYEAPTSPPTPIVLSRTELEILEGYGFPAIKSLRVYTHSDLFTKIKL